MFWEFPKVNKLGAFPPKKARIDFFPFKTEGKTTGEKKKPKGWCELLRVSKKGT